MSLFWDNETCAYKVPTEMAQEQIAYKGQWTVDFGLLEDVGM